MSAGETGWPPSSSGPAEAFPSRVAPPQALPTDAASTGLRGIQGGSHATSAAPVGAAPDSAHSRIEPVSAPTGDAAQHDSADAQPIRLHALDRWSLARLVATALILLLISTAAAYLASAGRPTVYGAQADLLFEVPGSSQEAERQLATQEVLLSSRGVLAPVAERFDVPLPVLTAAQAVELLPGTQVLRLQVHNEDPDLAVRLTQAIADGYITSVSSDVSGAGSEQEREARDQIAELSVTAAAGRARLDEIAAERATGRTTSAATEEERRLQVEDTALTQRINSLQTQLTEILVQGENARPAEILTPAYLLDEPVGPRPKRAAAAGAMIGLVLGAGLLIVALRRRTPLGL